MTGDRRTLRVRVGLEAGSNGSALSLSRHSHGHNPQLHIGISTIIKEAEIVLAVKTSKSATSGLTGRLGTRSSGSASISLLLLLFIVFICAGKL